MPLLPRQFHKNILIYVVSAQFGPPAGLGHLTFPPLEFLGTGVPVDSKISTPADYSSFLIMSLDRVESLVGEQ